MELFSSFIVLGNKNSLPFLLSKLNGRPKAVNTKDRKAKGEDWESQILPGLYQLCLKYLNLDFEISQELYLWISHMLK